MNRFLAVSSGYFSVEFEQITPSIGSHICYKICSDEQLNFTPRVAKSHWSGLYGQLSLSHAISYLSNKWDAGESSVTVVAVQVKKPISILRVIAPELTHSGIMGEVKAVSILGSLSRQRSVAPLGEKDLLVDGRGKQGFLMPSPDSSADEIIFPLSMWTDENFKLVPLYEIRSSEFKGMRQSHSWRVPTESWKAVKGSAVWDTSELRLESPHLIHS